MKDGGGHFTEVTLKPTVTIADGSDPELAKKLHEKAHHLCFIASSVNFPVGAKRQSSSGNQRPGRAHQAGRQVVISIDPDRLDLVSGVM
jgi:hypothetical protein